MPAQLRSCPQPGTEWDRREEIDLGVTGERAHRGVARPAHRSVGEEEDDPTVTYSVIVRVPLDHREFDGCTGVGLDDGFDTEERLDRLGGPKGFGHIGTLPDRIRPDARIVKSLTITSFKIES